MDNSGSTGIWTLLGLFLLGICLAPLLFLGVMEESGSVAVAPRTGSTATRIPDTLTPIPPTPTVDLALTTATPTRTPEPTSAPASGGSFTSGSMLSGPLTNGSAIEWTFEAEAGNVLSITNNNLGLTLEVYAPDGTLVTEPTDSSLNDVALPATGTYRLLARRTLGGGTYNLIVTIE